ncbi:MAG: DUF4349 domain-containing protein [Chloroflexi bacterium]|nr:DUF4349 domain-containing protein [Chloroflexota bacterium]
MRIRNLRRTWIPTLMLVLAVFALACGGAAESPAAPAMTEALYYADDFASAPESAQQRSGPPGAPGPAGSDGADRFGRQASGAAAAATAVPQPASQQQAAPAAPAAAVGRTGKESLDGASSQSVQSQTARKLIVESWMSLEVTNIDAMVRQVEALAAQGGGWVESSEVYGEAGYRSATVRIRVPADRLNNGLDSLRGMGRVTDEGVSSTDVTERLIDNEARLTAWYAQEERLVTLLENAPTVEDIIQIEQRIAEVRSDIEHVEATQRDLTGRVATSLITVNLRLPAQYAADPPVGSLQLSVDDPSSTADSVIARVEALGGYIGEKREFDEGSGRIVDLTVFVKPADLAGLMDYAATLGAPSGRQLSSVGPTPLNEVANARLTLGIRSDVELGASMSLDSSDPTGVAEKVRAQAESRGGFVEHWNEFQNRDRHRVSMELIVKASDLRSVMDYAAELGELQHWDYNAVGQNPSAAAPNARLNFSVATPEDYSTLWMILAGVVSAAVLVVIAIVALVLALRRRRRRRNEVGAAADMEPAASE